MPRPRRTVRMRLLASLALGALVTIGAAWRIAWRPPPLLEQVNVPRPDRWLYPRGEAWPDSPTGYVAFRAPNWWVDQRAEQTETELVFQNMVSTGWPLPALGYAEDVRYSAGVAMEQRTLRAGIRLPARYRDSRTGFGLPTVGGVLPVWPRWLGFAADSSIFGAAVFAAWTVLSLVGRRSGRVLRRRRGRCTECGYDRRGLGGACPECGA